METSLEKLIGLKYKLVPLSANGKTPLISQWPSKASDDPQVLEGWIAAFPNCNWGLATGSLSGIIVIDIDPRHGGDIQWQRLTLNKSIHTASCKTGGGGMHYYFKLPPNIEIKNFVGLANYSGIDVRGNGGQVVIPPSIHQSGNAYEWENAPWEVAPEIIPEWLLQILLPDQPTSIIGGDLVDGQRNNTIFHQSLMLARQGATMEFTVSTMKTWRDTSGATDLTDDELIKTIQSAYKRVETERVKRKNQMAYRTDSDNADRLIELYGNRIRYAPNYGWFIWDDRTWVMDDENAKLTSYATESMLILRDEALEEAKVPENFKSALAKAQWATNSLNLGRLNAATKLAATKGLIRISVNSLDDKNTKFLLNVNNGIVDLKTGNLMPHDPQLMITKQVDLDYDPTAECPFWLHTLELAFDGDRELIDYMQRAIGYSITGSVAEQCLFICWGEQGNNGKSTILETLQHMFGPYAQMSDMKVITSADMDNRVASSLAKLPGVRLVSMNEADENQKLSEALIKQITGGDTLQACKKFHEPFEFIPNFKLWIRTNEKPQIRGMSDAIWRRIKLIPFNKPIPKEHRLSRDTVDENLNREKKGILNWCIQGAIKWYANGLADPEIVTAATAGYRTEMDIVQSFFDECVVESSNASVGRSELYQAFAHWGKENGLRFIMSSDAFGKRVTKKINQTERVKVRGQYVWTGIKLNEEASLSLILQ